MSVDEMLCRWAEKKYGLTGVTRVSIDMEGGFDYSEYTPGDGPSLVVEAFRADGLCLRREDTYDTALIREILAFATETTRPHAYTPPSGVHR